MFNNYTETWKAMQRKEKKLGFEGWIDSR